MLVTSQTPRALKVLKGMIPPEMSALCVSLLGNDSTALKGLEDSVKGITNKQQNWNAQKNNKEIDYLRDRMNSLRKREADLNRRVREIRERKTYGMMFVTGCTKERYNLLPDKSEKSNPSMIGEKENRY